jgi:hypothetical protein
MAETLGTAITKILSDVIRGQELSSRVRDAIVDAIGFYRTKRFGFNQVTVSLSWSQSDIQALPTDWLATNRIRLLDPSYRAPLTERTVQYLDDKERATHGTGTGKPYEYAIQDRTIRVYPFPDSNQQVSFGYLKDLTEVSASAADSATNAWLGEAWPMIRAHALEDLYENYLQGEESDQKAANNRARAARWYNQLRSQADAERAQAGLAGHL